MTGRQDIFDWDMSLSTNWDSCSEIREKISGAKRVVRGKDSGRGCLLGPSADPPTPPHFRFPPGIAFFCSPHPQLLFDIIEGQPPELILVILGGAEVQSGSEAAGFVLFEVYYYPITHPGCFQLCVIHAEIFLQKQCSKLVIID